MWACNRSAINKIFRDAPAINRVVRHREHSQYTDLTRGGRDGGVGLVIYGDYLFHELAELSPARR